MLEGTKFPKHLTAGIIAAFQMGLDATVQTWQNITTVVRSTGSSEEYTWGGGTDSVTEWGDELPEAEMNEYSMTISNKKFGRKLRIAKDLIEDDRKGEIFARAKAFGVLFNRFMEEKAYATLAANGTGYDSQNLIDTDHDESGSDQSNKGTTALSAAELAAARLAMLKFKDDKGQFVGANPDLLVIPVDLEKTAFGILKSILVPDADTDAASDSGAQTQNFMYNRFSVVSTPYLTDTNNWYLVDRNQAWKPIVWQERISPQLMDLGYDGKTDDFTFQLRFRGNFKVGNWKSIYGEIVAAEE